MKKVRYGSVCSGIESATVAWRPLGWEPAWFAEIEPFPSAVLKHRYPGVLNRGDITKFKEWPDDPIDALVGGTPCQSFSVAGLRKGMADPRGNLALVFLAIVDRYRPSWVVWENVPGVFSSVSHEAPDPREPKNDVGMGSKKEGLEIEEEYDSEELHAFNCFLAALSELGYGYAYRVLDAQYFGVPQRRRRVFVVGHPRGECARGVLFERESLSWNPPPGRKSGKGASGRISPSLVGSGRGTERPGDFRGQDPVIECYGGHRQSEVASTIQGHAPRIDWQTETFVTHSLNGEGHDTSEDGTGRGVPLTVGLGSDPLHSKDLAQPMTGRNGDPGGQVAVAVDLQNGGEAALAGAIQSAGQAAGNRGYGIRRGFAVRRLTPRECERLQGFPDDYTLIPVKKKRKVSKGMLEYLRRKYPKMTMEEATLLASDGPRYKALGNSMAVPVMAWIGRRIEEVEKAVSSKRKKKR